MNKIEYKRMEERERSYWWHTGRLKIIEAYIEIFKPKQSNNKILNIGCGTGGTIKMLEKYGTTDNVDVSDEAIRLMKRNGFSRIKKVEGTKLPYKNEMFDLVGSFDVLEHIEDDVKALKEWKRVLKRGGSIIITVPAYTWLWSEHDVSLHHFRRYTIKDITEKASKVGLFPAKKSYAIVFSLPMVVGFRAIAKIFIKKQTSETSYVNVPKFVNRIFETMLFIESKLHKYISFPFGTSVIVVLKKIK